MSVTIDSTERCMDRRSWSTSLTMAMGTISTNLLMKVWNSYAAVVKVMSANFLNTNWRKRHWSHRSSMVSTIEISSGWRSFRIHRVTSKAMWQTNTTCITTTIVQEVLAVFVRMINSYSRNKDKRKQIVLTFSAMLLEYVCLTKYRSS